MKIDCHVHVCATSPGRGVTSHFLRRRFSFAYIRWRLGLPFFADDQRLEREVEERLVRTVNETDEIDAAVVLAFDWAYDNDGRRDDAHTHLAVTNEYGAELARKHSKLLLGASVHPYREDALAELEKCVAAGAVLVKWLPVVQNIDPTDRRCLPFYEALAALGSRVLGEELGRRGIAPAPLPRRRARTTVERDSFECGASTPASSASYNL